MQIRRTTIPYKGRSRWGAEGTKKTRRSTSVYTSGGGGAGGGNGINITPTGTATCYVDVSTSYIYDDALPATISMNVIGEVDNQRRPTYVQTQNITGGYPSMTITVTDNGTDHAVLRVTLPSGFNQSGMLTIPVMVNAATGQDAITPIGTQTMEEAFTARSKTTRVIDCYWEYSVLHMGSDGTVTRGPVMWSSSLARRFSNGVGPEAQDRVYMDLIKRAGDRNTYKCITSYTQTAGQTWDQVSANWQVDNSFDVIAGGLIMGTDATIELKEDNQIVVYNSNDDDVVTIDSDGINSNHIFSSDVTTLGITMKDQHLNTTATLASDGSLTTVGTVRTSGSVISTSVQTDSLRSNDITAVGTITAGPVISSSLSTGDITSVGTVTATKLAGTSIETGNFTLKSGNTQYGTMDSNGLQIGTVTTSRLKGNSIKILNDSGAQYGELTNGNGLQIGTIMTSRFKTNNLVFTDTSNVQYATMGSSGLNISTITTREMSFMNNNTSFGNLTPTNGLVINKVKSDSMETMGMTVKNSNQQVKLTLDSNGNVSAAGTITGTSVSGSTIAAEAYEVKDANYPNTYATTTSNNLGLSIAFVTDEYAYFNNQGTYWTFNGVDTRCPVASYPYVDTNSNEEYVFQREPGVFDESNVRTGVYTTSHVRSHGRIYLDMDNKDITVGTLSFTRLEPKE